MGKNSSSRTRSSSPECTLARSSCSPSGSRTITRSITTIFTVSISIRTLFTHVPIQRLTSDTTHHPYSFLLNEWLNSSQGIIIAGVAQPQKPREYCHAIAHLSQTLKFPVLAEGLSPVRNHADFNPNIISTYDLILRDRSLAKQLAPEVVIQIGEMPTSKELRNWLTDTLGQKWVVDPSDRNLDPLHGRTTHLRVSIEELGRWSAPSGREWKKLENSPYLELWLTAEAKVRANVNQTLAPMEELFEGKTAWLLSQTLPSKTPIFIANSMPVRDVEFFGNPILWACNPSSIEVQMVLMVHYLLL